MLHIFIWYHVLSWYSSTLCPFACDAAKSNFPMVRGTTVSRKMRKSSLLLRKMQKMCKSNTLQFDEARFFSPSNLFPQEGIGFTHEDEQGSQELETGDWKTEDSVVAVGIWRSVQRFLTGFVLDFIRSIIFLKLKSPDTNSWLVGYGFAGCFFVLWVFSHPTIYTSS